MAPWAGDSPAGFPAGRRRGDGEPVSNLAYLGAVIVLSLVGCLILWVRNREPRSMEARMREFSKELQALAPEDNGAPVRRWPANGRNNLRERRPG